MIDWQARARRLTGRLVASGALTDPAWQAAFAAVPRHVFVPRFLDGEVPVSSRDGTRWLDAVYSDEALMIARRAPRGSDRTLPTSSSSQPTVMAVMLDRLDVHPDSRVLEIGTGTGYNAALLCHRLGDDLVTSIDLDPDLTVVAAERLAQLGYQPRIDAADGTFGYPPRAPYDRIIATCAISAIPPAWVDQLNEGGRIVAPFAREAGGLIVAIKTGSDVVNGRFDAMPALFMPLRPKIDDPLGAGDSVNYTGAEAAFRGTTALDPSQITSGGPDLQLWLQLHLPGLHIGRTERRGLLLHTGTAMAHVSKTATNGRWLVIQRGTQRIWDTVETAVSSWERLGHPARTRLGITVAPAGQHVWLDRPDGRYSWPLFP